MCYPLVYIVIPVPTNKQVRSFKQQITYSHTVQPLSREKIKEAKIKIIILSFNEGLLLTVNWDFNKNMHIAKAGYQGKNLLLGLVFLTRWTTSKNTVILAQSSCWF